MRHIKHLIISIIGLWITTAANGADNPLDGGWGKGNHKTALNAIRKIEGSIVKNFSKSVSEIQVSAEILRLISFAEDHNFASQVAYAKASDSLGGILGVNASFGTMGGPEGRHVINGFSLAENESDYNYHISVSLHYPAKMKAIEFFGQTGHRFHVTIFRFPDNSVSLSVDAGKTVENQWGYRRSGVTRSWNLSSGERISWDDGFSESSNGIVSL